MTAKVPPKADKPAKPSKDTIYIDVEDEITAIIDKVEGARNKIVALVLPKRAASLQSVVNMRLLKRNSDKAGKSVVLITSEAALLPLAGAAGLHVAKNLQSQPAVPPSPLDAKELPPELDTTDSDPGDDPDDIKLDHHRAIGELAAAGAAEETISLDDDEQEPTPAAKPAAAKGSKLKIPDFDRFRLLIGGGIAALVLLIFFIILALFVLPKATITIQTTSTPISADIQLATSGSAQSLDEANGVIPSAVKTSKQLGREQVPATGQKNNGEKANGNVNMTAKKCSGNPFVSPADVPAGTGLGSGGNTYITQDNTSFHGTGVSGGCFTYAADDSTGITAQAAGTKYNVSGASFSVFGRSDVSASGSASGGTDDIKTVVSQQDVDGAKQKITSKNSDDFSKKFQKDLEDQGYYVLTSTLKLTEPKTTATPNVGDEASNVNVTTEITYSVMVVNKDDLRKAITHELNKQVDTKKQQISSSDVVKDATISVQDQTSPTNAQLHIDENTTAIPIIDVTHVKQQAAGHKVGDIRAFISGIPGVEKVDVKLSPFWVSKAPKQSKITVKIQQIKSTANDQQP